MLDYDVIRIFVLRLTVFVTVVGFEDISSPHVNAKIRGNGNITHQGQRLPLSPPIRRNLRFDGTVDPLSETVDSSPGHRLR